MNLDTTRPSLAALIAFSVVAAVAQPSAKVSPPSPWPYYLQVYPGSDPSTSGGGPDPSTSGDALRPPPKSLYFGLMMSFASGDFNSAGAIPGVQAALDQINGDPTLLPGYQLHYTLTDSQVCDAWCREFRQYFF